ncbi:RHS repeat-associated protein, partial [Dysgonomonas sp. PFB1-18]
MKKYILVSIISMLSCYQLNSQVVVGKDSISLNINSDEFTTVISRNDTIYQRIPRYSETVEPIHNTGRQLKSGQTDTHSAPMALSGIPTSGSIDPTKEVGEITIESNVANGALTYNVPINIYQGKNGFQPDLALMYNSMNGNNIAGYGWNIGGLSLISIAHSNYYYDGANSKAATNDKNSALTLDGMRLIKLSETTSQINYQSEQGNIKVIFYAPSGKYYFDVLYPDGTKAVFGYETNTTSKTSYPITKKTDLIGNYINYTYSLSNNVYYISEIKYGSTAAVNGTVKFTYKTRTDVNNSYIAGILHKEDKLLSQIDSYYQTSTLLYTYGLTHELNVYNFLSKLSLKADAKELNPLTFYYGGDNYTASYVKSDFFLKRYFPNSKAPDLIIKKGKFNNQKKNDGLIGYPKFEPYTIIGQDNSGNCLYGSNYSETQKIFIYRDLRIGDCIPDSVLTGKGFTDFFAVDYNGDGDDELVRVNYWFQSDMGRVDLTTYDKNMNASNFYFLIEGAFAQGSRRSPVPRTFLTGDFRGIGKSDLVAVSSYVLPKNVTRPSSRTNIIDLANKSMVYNNTPFKYDYFKDVLFAVDYDGDGKTDICLINAAGIYIYSYINNTFQQIAYSSALTNYAFSSRMKKQLFVGDINGDGIIDFLVSPRENDYTTSSIETPCGMCDGCRGGGGSILQPLATDMDDNLILFPIEGACRNPMFTYEKTYNSTYRTWTILSGTGTGFSPSTFAFQPIESEWNYKFILHDINGDKLPDILVKSGTSASVYLNKNGAFNLAAEQAKLTLESNSHFITGSVSDGYGFYSSRTSQLLSITDAHVVGISYTKNDAQERMLTGMVNSFGVVQKTNYANMMNSSMYRQTSYTPTLPYTKLFMDINLVNSTSVYSNDHQISSTYYYYNDAVYHKQGLGFRGFQKITASDGIKNTSTVQTFDPQRFGVLTSIDGPTTQANLTYNVSVATNKIATINLSNKVEKDKLKNISISSGYTYDSYGNITQEVTTYETGIKKTTVNSYNNYTGTLYKIGELYNQVVTQERNGQTWTDRMYIPVFDSQTRLPIVIAKFANGNQTLAITYTYTSGLPTKESIQEFTGSLLATHFTYDSFGRKVSMTNSVGLTKTYAYNAKGLLSSQKNHKGHETKYEYNSWGQNIKTTYPDAVVESNIFAWATTPTSALFSSTATKTGSPTSQTFYDRLGREVRTGKIRFDGKYIYTDKVYDNKGRIQKVSMPFKGTSPTQWNTYTYDSYDRLTVLNYASGKADTCSYASNNVTSVIDDVSKTVAYNSIGDIISITDTAGTIKYNLRPDGKPSSIVAPGNVTTTMEYDTYGRQTKLIDPSSGTKTYTYNANGKISQETDARGNTTKLTYDAYNRLTKKEIAGQTITYVYNADNLPASETSSNGTSKVYTYDALLRLSAVKETAVDGKWLQKTYTYSGGRIASTAYSANTGSIVTENYTYMNGTNTEIKLNNTTSIWKLTAENDFGYATEGATGSLVRTYTYNAYGMPTARTIKKDGTVLMNFGYNINARTGNLTWRKDNTRNFQENFAYDNLNRLTAFAGKTATYDTKGNITAISGVGTFEYGNTSKPYMLTGVTPYGTEIPLRAQLVTYNAQQRPATITENGYVATFTYNGDGSRVKMNLKNNGADNLTRYYIGDVYESDAGIAGNKERLYLGGNAYSAAAVYVKEGTGAWTLYFIGRDYLGSITHVFTSAGVLKQELSYDAWGRLRNPANQALYAVGSEPALFLGRGYTGHEHLTVFGLINMNARLYDPALGRFLSPDPYVQDPNQSQNYNRYSYCLNNPLRYTDESGEIFGFIGGLFKGGFNLITGLGKWAFGGGSFSRDVLQATWKPVWNGM